MGLYLDEWIVGKEYETPTRTITESDVLWFAAMSGDYNEIHTSKQIARNTPFGQRLVHGLLGLAISHGLIFRTGVLEGTAIAFLGIDSWNFTAPIFIGDTIKVMFSLLDKKPSKSKPDRGVIKLSVKIINEEGKIVQDGVKTIMMKRKV